MQTERGEFWCGVCRSVRALADWQSLHTWVWVREELTVPGLLKKTGWTLQSAPLLLWGRSAKSHETNGEHTEGCSGSAHECRSVKSLPTADLILDKILTYINQWAVPAEWPPGRSRIRKVFWRMIAIISLNWHKRFNVVTIFKSFFEDWLIGFDPLKSFGNHSEITFFLQVLSLSLKVRLKSGPENKSFLGVCVCAAGGKMYITRIFFCGIHAMPSNIVRKDLSCCRVGLNSNVWYFLSEVQQLQRFHVQNSVCDLFTDSRI